MTLRKVPAQTRLPGVSGRRKVGTAERLAAADIRKLRELNAIAPGMAAVESAYKRLAGVLDAGWSQQDDWKLLNAARELRNTRAALAPGAVYEGDDSLERFLAQLPSTPRGNAEEPRTA